MRGWTTTMTVGFGDASGWNYGGTISGNMALAKIGSGWQQLSGNGNTYTGGTTVNGGTVDLSYGNGIVFNVSRGTAASDLAITGNIRGASAGGIALHGNGVMVLSGSDTYSGGTVVTGGTLDVTTSSALPGGSSLTVNAGGTFVFNSSSAGSPAAPSPGVAAAPQPGTLALLITGLVAGLGIWRRMR
jgi:fibronectin-binding autotransporter adhesin